MDRREQYNWMDDKILNKLGSVGWGARSLWPKQPLATNWVGIPDRPPCVAPPGSAG